MTATTNAALTAETIAKFEAAGFNRWAKGSMDRLYINTTALGDQEAPWQFGIGAYLLHLR